MQTTTPLFDRRIRQSGHRKTVADLYLSGQVVKADLPISKGNITTDRSSAVRRSGNITIADKSFVQEILGGLLLPYGYEIRVRQGIVYPDRSEELVPLGVFMVYGVDWDDSEGQIPSLRLFDRSKMMADNQSVHTFSFSGHSYAFAIQTILDWHYNGRSTPELQVEFHEDIDVDAVIPGGTIWDRGSLLEIVQQASAAIGGEFYFTAEGIPVVRPAGSIATATQDDSVWSINVGENGIMTKAHRSISREGVYNRVTVWGAGQQEDTPQPTYSVWDYDMASLSRRQGPFGVVDLRIEDNTLLTVAQCQMVAENKMAEVKRLSADLSFSCIANPALEEGDVVTVEFLSGDTQLALLETLDYPIGGGEQTGRCSIGRL